jgi:hypothetical protein
MENNIREFHITFFKICDDNIQRLSGQTYFADNILKALECYYNDPKTPDDPNSIKYIIDRTNISYSEMNLKHITLQT